jgi:undecaprenyl-diphosphatase
MNFQSIIDWDNQVSQQLRLKGENKLFWRLATFTAHSGDSWFWLPGLGVAWIFSSGVWRIRLATIIFGMIFLALFVLAIKFTVRRARPAGEWGAIYRNTDPHSFPSGHAARAAMLAVAMLGLGPAWLGILLLLWAPLVCLARVATGVHYLSDVAAGILIGILMGSGILWVQPLLISRLPFFF